MSPTPIYVGKFEPKTWRLSLCKRRVLQNLFKIKHHLGGESKANKQQGSIILRGIKLYANTYAYKYLNAIEIIIVRDVKLTNQLLFKNWFANMWSNIQEISG